MTRYAAVLGFALAVWGASASTSAQTLLFFGEDLNANSMFPPNGLAAAARNEFLQQLTFVSSESFESYPSLPAPPPTGTQLNLQLNLTSSTGTFPATLSGVDSFVRNTAGSGVFPSSGVNFLQTNGEMVLDLRGRSAAGLGFFITDVESDPGFGVRLQLASGETREYLVPTSLPAPDGAIAFWGYVDYNNPFTKVTFLNASLNDGFGFDDMSIALVQDVVEPLDPSVFRVDLRTGRAWIVGGDPIAVPINSYEVTSGAGVLLPQNLQSFAAQGLDPTDGPADPDSIAGNSTGEVWEVVNAAPDQIFEARLFGSSSFDASRSVYLGQIYDRTLGQDNTLRFTYQVAGIPSTVAGRVEFFTSPALAGDYNLDGRVDAADYTVWRDSEGQTGAMLPADGDNSGTVDAADYAIWTANFGAASAAAAAQAIPEPSAMVLVIGGGLLLTAGRKELA